MENAMTTLTRRFGSDRVSAQTDRPRLSLASVLRRLLRKALARDLLARERDYMERLDERTLRDIGLTRADIEGALSRPEQHMRSILLRGGDEV
jgi:uncharacterized protein YjiS (DUF1127 family)